MFTLSIVLTLKVYTLSILLSIPDFAIPASRVTVRPAERFPYPSTEKHFSAGRISMTSADPLRSDLPVNENGENRPQIQPRRSPSSSRRQKFMISLKTWLKLMKKRPVLRLKYGRYPEMIIIRI